MLFLQGTIGQGRIHLHIVDPWYPWVCHSEETVVEEKPECLGYSVEYHTADASLIIS
jgi:hypothetical protein